jgi:hypothetical protein
LLGGHDPVTYECADGASAADLRAALDQVQALLAPLSADELVNELTKLRLALRSRAGTDAELRGQILVYAEQLEDLPADVLRHAVRLSLRTEEFFPSITRLLEMCAFETDRRRRLAAALERALAAALAGPSTTQEEGDR